MNQQTPYDDSQADPARLAELDRRVVWHAFTQMADYEPLIIEQADGCELIDIDGNRYLDGVSSLWCTVHGHNHATINAAIEQQLKRVAHVTSLGMSNPTTIALAERLVELTPEGLGHVFFSSDGASAIEVALKMAFQYWRQTTPARPDKSLFVALGSAYHGDTLGSVSVGGVTRFHEMFQPLLFDVLRGPLPDSYRLPEHVGPDQAADYYLDQLDQLLSEHQQQIAAVIVEPLVQGAAGMVMHPPGFLAGVRRLTRQYGLLMIADEVAVGFGRTGTMFACQQEQVSPDLLCLGKGLSGGYLAMAATLASSEIFEAFLGSGDASRTFYHGHTYGGNPLAAAAALASLEVFSEEQTLARLPAKIELLADQLKPLWNLPLVGDIRQCGLLAAIELVADKETRQPLPAAEQTGARVCQLAQQQGVWLRPLRDVLVVMPPLSVSDEQICRIVDTLAAAIAEIGQKVDIEQGGGRG